VTPLRRTAREPSSRPPANIGFVRPTPGIPKSPAHDAACVGEVATLVGWAAIDACNQDNGTRPLLHEIGQVRIPTRLLHGHQVRGVKTDDEVRAMCEPVPVRASVLAE
jgi:hypothetical protein